MATEDEIVDLIREMTGTDKDVLCGIGDDAAILQAQGNILATTDQLVEGVHFKREYTSLGQIGRKAVAVNVSDIAAMGGKPKYALVSLALPQTLSHNDIKDILKGIAKGAASYGIKIVGGDLSRAESIIVSLSLLGDAPASSLLRSAAREGDKIWVTGTLGDSAAGLEALERKIDAPSLIEKHLNPAPRLEEGQILRGLARSMMDISDGLGSDLNRLCRESGVGAGIYIDRLPLSEPLRNLASSLGQPATNFALYGGEDYELLFTAAPEASENILSTLSIPVTAIGEIISAEEGIRLIHTNGKSEPLKWGFDHFSNSDNRD
jgi:thiamine-monophosphate kinase